MDTPEVKRPFWSNPEGTTGMIFGLPIAALLLYGLYKVLPFVITLLQNAITATILAVVFAIMLYVLMDPKFWLLLWNIYKSIMRRATNLWTTIDPLGVMKNYIEDLKDKKKQLVVNIKDLWGQMVNLKTIITKNAKEQSDAITMAKRADEQGDQGQKLKNARKAGRRESNNKELYDMYLGMQKMLAVLKKADETCDIIIEDQTDEVAQMELKNKALSAGSRAMRSIAKILQGDDEKEMFDNAKVILAEQMAQKVGEIEYLLNMSQEIIKGVDLQNGIFEEKGLDMLKEWEKNSNSILFGEQGKQQLTGSASFPMLEASTAQPFAMGGSDVPVKEADYANLFSEGKA